ncbi:MAG: peptide deformylase [Desulfobacteraceae bacterium 4572_35.1]|nr:MAG: peptide deformylase [Desulfobacteraceae bacterium 4572_35.1]
MALLQIRRYPDPVLAKSAAPIAEIDDEVRTLVDNMVETMYAAPGVGLAGPQVAVLRRVVVIDCGGEEDPQLIVAINPEILDRDGESYEEEGCLSVPEYYAKVKRSSWVRVRYQNIDGQVIEMETGGLLAVCFQHEIDHLEGKLFVDRLSSLKKGIFRKKYIKILEQQQEQL